MKRLKELYWANARFINGVLGVAGVTLAFWLIIFIVLILLGSFHDEQEAVL